MNKPPTHGVRIIHYLQQQKQFPRIETLLKNDFIRILNNNKIYIIISTTHISDNGYNCSLIAFDVVSRGLIDTANNRLTRLLKQLENLPTSPIL